MSLLDMQSDDLSASHAPVAAFSSLFKENCKKCGGSGRWVPSFGFGAARTCFGCNGRGYNEYKTSTQQRAAARERATARAARAAAESVEAFAAEFPAEHEWMVASAPRFEFAQSMLDAVRKYGSLTERQLAAVQNCVNKAAQRTAERQQRIAAAPAISVEAIEVAFSNAKAAGIKYPKLRLDTFVFSPASESSANAGALYVKEGETYLGKVLGGKLFAVRDCSEDAKNRILAVASDPAGAAVAYGKKFGSCAVCNRELSDPVSIERGIGPICAGRFGW